MISPPDSLAEAAPVPAVETPTVDKRKRRMELYFYGFLLLAVLLEGTADLMFRKWGLDRQKGSAHWLMFAFSMAVYMSGAACWGLSLQFKDVSRAIVGFAVLNVVIVAFAGLVVFGEQLSFVNRLGIVMGMASLIMVEWRW
jgi:drug/metabolite transporter (DMT)-like permease